MNADKVLADFQFLGNRVCKFNLDIKLIDGRNRAEVSFDFDYSITDFKKNENNYFGTLQFIVKIKAKVKNKVLFKIDLVMEGYFSGNPKVLSEELFLEMLEMNGLITLVPIARSYVVSVSAQSGITPPIKIPMINIFKLREKKKNSIPFDD